MSQSCYHSTTTIRTHNFVHFKSIWLSRADEDYDINENDVDVDRINAV